MATATGSWALAATNVTWFTVQARGEFPLEVQAVPTGGDAPGDDDMGILIGQGELFALSDLAGHDVYRRAPNGNTTYVLISDEA